MSGRPVDLTERIGNWAIAYDAVRREIIPEDMRTKLATMAEFEGIQDLNGYMTLARNVMAGDRTAGLIAMGLVTTGIRPAPVETDEVQ